MKTITSRDNSLYKELKHLASSAQVRRKSGRTLLDGVHLCRAYLDQVGMPPLCVMGESAQANAEVSAIIDRCKQHGVQCILLPDALYQGLSQVEQGVGLLFVIDIPGLVAPNTLTQAAVLLDKLQDPGNLGSILRTAAAAGITQIYCSRETAFCWSPKVLRAGMGAHFLLEIFENADLELLVAHSALPVLATSSHAAQSIFEIDLARPLAWLFGNEGQGVSSELMARTAHRVTIPHLGPVESLNVAACAAVCLFEQLRQQLQAR